MKIRPAIISDMPGIVRCAESFFEYAEYAKNGMTLDKSAFEKKVEWYIKDEKGIVLLLVNQGNVCGGISGYVSEWDFNPAVKILIEFFFWIDPEYRGNGVRLLKAFESIGKENGAQKIVMISPQTFLKSKVDRMYEKFGYQPTEQFWMKGL